MRTALFMDFLWGSKKLQKSSDMPVNCKIRRHLYKTTTKWRYSLAKSWNICASTNRSYHKVSSICPMRQVFPMTEFPLCTKSYITLWQRKQQRISVWPHYFKLKSKTDLYIARLTHLLCFTCEWRISKASRSMQQLAWTGRLKTRRAVAR